MECPPETTELFRKERLEFSKLLASNPNYFGTVANTEFPVVQPIKSNTSYEVLTCVGLWPERNLLEATLQVKLPFGFLGPMCSPGSNEYVRFFIDWDNDGDFDDFNEDVGLAKVNVHDIPEVEKHHHLCYAVRRRFRPLFATCKDPYIVKLRAILSWEAVPPPGDWNYTPVWGNVLECWIQIDPVEGKVLGIVQSAAAGAVTAQASEQKPRPQRADKERLQFLGLIRANPNYFGTLAISDLKAVFPQQGDTRYEELKCIGLYPERNFLEAIIHVKLPYGFLGDLCSPGSHEFVRFFIDWNGDGDFVDFNEDVGVTAVRVHDIPQVREHHLCYAVGRSFRPLRASCQHPYIVRVRAILSWQQVPTGPNFLPVWGNVVECWVQVNPTEGVIPHLVGEIDTPALNACVAPELVPACMTGSTPLAGIRITGTAAGAPFHHYTLRYSWGGNPPVNDAVVYPDCSRPPAATSYAVPVVSGTLGYLDVTLLPPGQTDFTVYLDVYDAAAGHVAVSRAFALKTKAVEISAAATVGALEAEDPFNLGTFTKLIKATNNASPTVPEQSIGGAFSVTGSAYVVGCDRILTQYVLTRLAAPPAAPVPNFPDATGGSPLIAPVVYADSPAHPWQSGCLGLITPNIVLNGNLVSFWSSINCIFLGTTYTVPKVRPVPFWGSGVSGRYVILLEVRDRLLPAGPFPGDFAAKDQVVVWIDNHTPIAKINSVGGLGPCADLHLKNYVGTTATIRGVAWDFPIVPTAPQQAPNDNFGSYSMSFQKNGGAPFPLAAVTPTTRVPNIWPGPLVPADEGTLADWDIVGALDGGIGPLPPGSPKLLRGERCAFVIALSVTDTTHVGDSGNHNTDGPVLYALNIINDIT
jgi:hypothetical protein